MKSVEEILKEKFPNAEQLDWFKPIVSAINEDRIEGAAELERVKQLLYKEFFDRRDPYKSDLRISNEWKQFKQTHKL